MGEDPMITAIDPDAIEITPGGDGTTAEDGQNGPDPGGGPDTAVSAGPGGPPDTSVKLHEDIDLPAGVSTVIRSSPYAESLKGEDVEEMSLVSRAAQHQLAFDAIQALQAVGSAMGDVLSAEKRREMRRATANAMADAAVKPENFLDAMEERPSKHSGEDGATEESRRRKQEHHRKYNGDRPNECLGSPPGEENVGHHSALLDLLWTDTGAAKQERYDEQTGEWTETYPTKFVAGRYGAVPSWLLNTNAVTNTEVAILSWLYEKHDEDYRHIHGKIRVSGWTQATIGHHCGNLSRRHVNRLLQSLAGLGLIDIQHEGDFTDPNVYYLPTKEPTWLTFPLGSTYSGRARVVAAARLNTDKIDWSSFRMNEDVRIRAQADREAAKRTHDKDGTLLVDEKHRQVRVSGEGRDATPGSLGAAVKDWILDAIPASAREAFENEQEKDKDVSLATTPSTHDGETEIEHSDPDELPTFEQRVEERLQRLVAAEGGEVSPQRRKDMRRALERSMKRRNGGAGGKGREPPGCG